MAKLRKMLGDVQAPVTVELMRLIETQSQRTLTHWAQRYAQTKYLPILEAHADDGAEAAAALDAVQRYLRAELPLKDVKPFLKAARLYAAGVKDPTAQAAARAIAVACAVCTTPTGALGFLFYGAAASCYHSLGVGASAEAYDHMAEECMQAALQDLRGCAVPDEACPVRIDWGC